VDLRRAVRAIAADELADSLNSLGTLGRVDHLRELAYVGPVPENEIEERVGAAAAPPAPVGPLDRLRPGARRLRRRLRRPRHNG
jgi:hypothetical protein